MIQYDIVEVFTSRNLSRDTNHIGPFSDLIQCEIEARWRIAGYKHTRLIAYIVQRNPLRIIKRMDRDSDHATVSSGVTGEMIEKYDL